MRELMMVPSTWPCDNYTCPTGFFVYKNNLYIRLSKHTDYNEEGENVEFEGPEIVHPCRPLWIEIES